MILAFDLDDTLYDESTYVEGGLAAVADYAAAAWGLDPDAARADLREILARDGRGAVFDRWLQTHGLLSRARVRVCVGVYRSHAPRLALHPAALRALERYRRRAPLYLVTDGNKLVQGRKVAALGLAPMFRRVLITHRFGRAAAKPSTLCFERIRAAEGCAWADMAYVGDDPSKDFVGLNPLGVLTVRVTTGRHARASARPGFDAAVTIPDLDRLPDALATRFADA